MNASGPPAFRPWPVAEGQPHHSAPEDFGRSADARGEQSAKHGHMTPVSPAPPISALVDPARELALDACAHAAVRVAPVDSVAASRQVADLLDAVWGRGTASLPAPMIRALADAGNYVVGLYEAGSGHQLLGASVGFFAEPSSRQMHSHITGILPTHRGRHLGTAVKLHQRAWALARGIRSIRWTFDPLVSRNAHCNLECLGARVESYRTNFYGPISDDINQDRETDRFGLTWVTEDPWPRRRRPPTVPANAQVVLNVGRTMEPVSSDLDPGAGYAYVGIPTDIEAIRSQTPELAAWWRQAVRQSLRTMLDDGFVVEGFTAHNHYVLCKAPC